MYYSIKPILRTDKPVKRNEKFSVYYLIRVGHFQMKIPAKMDARIEHWNKMKGEFNQKAPNYSLNNSLLKNKMNDFERFMIMNIHTNRPVTKDDVKGFFSGKQSDCFYTYYEEKMKRKKRTLAKATIDKYKETLTILKEYKPDVRFCDLTLKFIEGFDDYMRTERNNNDAGTFNRHKNLKTMIISAMKEDIIQKNPYMHFKLKSTKANRTFLTSSEVRRIEEIELSPKNKYLEKTIDMFLFCCYTGLRYSDISNLKWNNTDMESIELRMKKTGKVIRIPLMKKAAAMLRKYYEITGFNLENLVFLLITNQKVNAFLKDIAREAKITKNLTFHVARHTFASNLVASGVHILEIKELLGHSQVRETEIYAKADLSGLEKSIHKLESVFTY